LSTDDYLSDFIRRYYPGGNCPVTANNTITSTLLNFAVGLCGVFRDTILSLWCAFWMRSATSNIHQLL